MFSVVIFFTTEGTEKHREFYLYFSVYLYVLFANILHHGGHGEAQRVFLYFSVNLCTLSRNILHYGGHGEAQRVLFAFLCDPLGSLW